MTRRICAHRYNAATPYIKTAERATLANLKPASEQKSAAMLRKLARAFGA